VEYLVIALQWVVALGILDVWMLRTDKATPFRGGDAKDLPRNPPPTDCRLG